MRRSSVGQKSAPIPTFDGVVLRNKLAPPPAIGPGFMRRSCTFVTEGSWRKSSFGIGSAQKDTKDRMNLALQVRKKANELGNSNGESAANTRQGSTVSRLMGNLRSWNSTEDVRLSVVGALTRTVNVMKHRPTSKKVKPTKVLPSSSSSSTITQPSKKCLPATSSYQQNKYNPPVVRTANKTKPISSTNILPSKTRPVSAKSQTNKTSLLHENGKNNRLLMSSSSVDSRMDQINPKDRRWLRHLQDTDKACRSRKEHPSPLLADVEDTSTSTEQRDVDDGVDGENNSESLETECLSSRGKQDDSSITSTAPAAAPSSPEPLPKKELLRRKDLKIRQELEEKQNLIADILNIPREHFESVADMAGEVGLTNKEPRELVLGAIFQAKRLQEAINEAQMIKDSDVIAAQADILKANTLPLYQGPMEKLLCISGTLTQLLNSLMSLVSERDEERERMRKELVASRERIHQMHMQQNDCSVVHCSIADPTTCSPISSRPSSFVSVSSSAAEHSDSADQTQTDEDNKNVDRMPSVAEIQSNLESSSEKEETSGGDSPNQMRSSSKDLTDSSMTLTEDGGLST